MAQGDVVVFDQFLLEMAKGEHDMSTHVIKLALIDSTTPLVDTLAIPHWNGTGTTNLFSNQVAITANYTGPVTLASNTVTLNAGAVEIDWADPSAWAAHASGDTDCKWAVIYNDTHASKHCVGYVDLGTAYDMTTGTLTITFGTPAVTLNQA